MTTKNPLSNLARYNVILASNSPRRRELLTMIGVNYDMANNIDVPEDYPDTMAPEDVPAYLSNKKSYYYKKTMTPDQLLITADTLVILGKEILGKPATDEEAKEMLRKLSGQTHKVVTGVTIITTLRSVTFSVCSEVSFGDLSDEDINYYVNRSHPLDKAGGYGVQEWIGAIGIRSINGSFYNVMGLPTHRLFQELLKF